MEVKSGSLGCEQQEEFSATGFVPANSNEMDELDASTLALKAETARLEELSKLSAEKAAKDSRSKQKGDVQTLPQKVDSEMEYFSGTGGGKKGKIKKKTKKEVSTLSLEELGCRDITKGGVAPPRVYHPPPPPPAVSAWSQKSGSQLFSDVSCHSLTVYGGDDDDQTLKLVLEESIRTACEEQDRILNLYHRNLPEKSAGDKRGTEAPPFNVVGVPAVEGKPWKDIECTTTVTALGWEEPVPTGDGRWQDPKVVKPNYLPARSGSDDFAGEGAPKIDRYQHRRNNPQHPRRPRNTPDSKAKDVGRDEFDNEGGAVVKSMGKANFSKRENPSYNSHNSSRPQNQGNSSEEDQKQTGEFDNRSRNLGPRHFENRPRNSQPGRTRGGRGGGQNRNWNSDRFQGPSSENRNKSRPVETVNEESWDDGGPPSVPTESRTHLRSNKEPNRDWRVSSTTEDSNHAHWNGNVPAVVERAIAGSENWDEEDESKVAERNNEAETPKSMDNVASNSGWNETYVSEVSTNSKNTSFHKNSRTDDWKEADTLHSSRGDRFNSSRNDRYPKPRSERNDFQGSRRETSNPRSGRNDSWSESRQEVYSNQPNGWRNRQPRKQSEEEWEDGSGSDRTSQKNGAFNQNQPRKRGGGPGNRGRNFGDNWNHRDGHQGGWNRREENSRLEKENFGGNRTFYRTKNYAENKSRNEEQASGSCESGASSMDHDINNPQVNDFGHGNVETCNIPQQTETRDTSVPSKQRLSDQVLHYIASITEEGEPNKNSGIPKISEEETSEVENYYVEEQPSENRFVEEPSSQNQFLEEQSLQNHFMEQQSPNVSYSEPGDCVENAYGVYDQNSDDRFETNICTSVEDTQQLQYETEPQEEAYYEEQSSNEQETGLVSYEDQEQRLEQPAEEQRVPVRHHHQLSADTKPFNYNPSRHYGETQRLAESAVNGLRNSEDVSKGMAQNSTMPVGNSVDAQMLSNIAQRYVPNSYYPMVPPPGQLNATMMMGVNVPIPGNPYTYSVPPNLMVSGQMAQNIYANNTLQEVATKSGHTQEHIAQNMQQMPSMKQVEAVAVSTSSNVVENNTANMMNHPNVSVQSPMYHPAMAHMYAAYSGLQSNPPVHSNAFQAFLQNSGVSQKASMNQTLHQNHQMTNTNMVSNANVAHQSYNSNLNPNVGGHPNYQPSSNGVGANGVTMMDPQVQRLNAIKESLLKQVLSGNMTDPLQIAAAATLFNQMQPGTVQPSQLYMAANPQYYPGVNVNYQPSSSMMNNGYCSGVLETNSSTPSVDDSASPHPAPSVYSATTQHPSTVATTQSHDRGYHPQSKPGIAPNVIPPQAYVYQHMYSHHQQQHLYQNANPTHEQLSLLQQQMVSLSMGQQQTHPAHHHSSPPPLPPHIQQQLQQPPPGFNV